jgi:hypothetical protein
MKKSAYFASEWYEGWPEPHEIERYFMAPRGQQWYGGPGRTDTAVFRAEGAEGTEHLQESEGRIYVDLRMWGRADLGVLFVHWRRARTFSETYTSVGDLNRLDEMMMGAHGDILPIGLFVPFEQAWMAVKEFIATEGHLPSSIEWIANKDLPANSFPEPTRENAKRYGLI